MTEEPEGAGGSERVRDAGYDDWLDAVAAREGYYLACSRGHGSLPPRRACPQCGDRDLTEEPLPETGEVVAHTTIHVATPRFEGVTPYATAVAQFGAVRLTGFVPDPDDVTDGARVTVAVDTVGGQRSLRLDPR